MEQDRQVIVNKTRTSKVGAISKAQKAQNIIIEKTNINSVAKYQLSKKLKGDPSEEKFFLKVSQCRKTERGDPLRFFNIHSVAKHQKIEGEKFLFSEKILTMPKKTERGSHPVWYVTRENRKNLFGPVR